MTSVPDDLEQLRIVERADVFKGGQLAATLTRTPDGTEFRYLDDWVANDKPPVATTLPVSREPVLRPAARCRPTSRACCPRGVGSERCAGR